MPSETSPANACMDRARALLQDVRAKGVRFRRRDGMIAFRDPQKALTEHDKRHLTDLKPELTGLLSQEETVGEFAVSGSALVAWSEVLADRIVLAADNLNTETDSFHAWLASRRLDPDVVIYRARELLFIAGPDGAGVSADYLRLIHEVKVQFGTEVTDDPLAGMSEEDTR